MALIHEQKADTAIPAIPYSSATRLHATLCVQMCVCVCACVRVCVCQVGKDPTVLIWDTNTLKVIQKLNMG